MEAFNCNVCGATGSGSSLLKIRQPDRFERAMNVSNDNYERAWVLCGGCGAAVNLMSAESLQVVHELEQSYYEIDLNGKDGLIEKYNRVMALPDDQSDNKQRVRRVLDMFFPDASLKKTIQICDIGSGLGVFLSELIPELENCEFKNVRATGIEPDPVAFEFLNDLSLFEVRSGLFPDVVHEELFDLITLNKVLEHIEEPLSLIESCSKHLVWSGGLYIEVPCITNAWLKEAGDDSLGCLHRNLYSIESVCRLLSLSGMTPVKAERFSEPSGKISVYVYAKKLAVG